MAKKQKRNLKEDKMRRLKVTIVLTLLLLICLLPSSLANQYFANTEEDLSYEYSFSQKYIVAGERVLNITILKL